MNLAENVSGDDGVWTRPARVLVLDDDGFDRKRLRRWAKRARPGFVSLYEAETLSEFKTHLRHETLDMVVVDYSLTDGTGLDALDALRCNRKNALAFALLVSGRDDERLKAECEAHGCDMYLHKSALDLSQVAQAVEHAMARGGVTDIDPEVVANRPATAYWHARAMGRAHLPRPGSQNATIIPLPAMPNAISDHTHPMRNAAKNPESRRRLDPEVSARLRDFIEEFLSPDEFDFGARPPKH